MRILVVNPNTTASMTEKIGAAARRIAAPGTEIVARNPLRGPASIEGYYDEAMVRLRLRVLRGRRDHLGPGLRRGAHLGGHSGGEGVVPRSRPGERLTR